MSFGLPANTMVREGSGTVPILRPEEVDFTLLPIPSRKLQGAPLSVAQQQVWECERHRPGDRGLRCNAMLRLQGDLDAKALQRALDRVLRRQEALRTSFDEIASEPYQRPARPCGADLPQVDLGGIPQEMQERTLVDVAARQLQRRIDLTLGRPFCALLARLSKRRYALAFSAHRLAWDAESASLLANQLLQLYASPQQRLDPLPVQYSDFAVWQRRGLRGKALQRRREFWRERLAQAPARLDLPADYGREAGQVFRPARAAIEFGSALTHKIEDLAKRQGATLLATLLTALQALLSRWTGQDEVVICTLVSQRRRAELAPLIGLLDSLIALPCSLSPQASFRDLVEQQGLALTQALDQSDLPLGADAEVEVPLQAALLLQPRPAASHQTGGLRWSCQAVQPKRTPFELALSLQHRPQRLEGEFVYASELFDPPTIQRLAGQLARLLEGMAQDPHQAVQSLPLLSEAERSQILVQWDRTDPPPRAADCLCDLFEEQAERRPGHAAVTFQGDSLSYGELNLRANQVAGGLASMIEAQGQPVAMLLDNGPLQIVALIAILKAGQAFVCLDPSSPSARLQAVLDEARPACLVSQSSALAEHRDLLEAFSRQGRVAILDRPAAELDGIACVGREAFENRPGSNPRLAVGPSSPAYIAYTSGSTGRPKGILHTHGSLASFLAWYGPRFGYSASSRIAVWTAITFDPTYCEILAGLSSGATLCLAPALTKKDPSAMIDWLVAAKATYTEVVPSFARTLLPVLQDRAGRQGGHPLPEMRRIGFVGEVLPVSLVKELLQLLGDCPRLANLYGPTETVMATSHDIRSVGARQRSIPVGRPMGGSQVLILDRNGQLCPIGVKGEIHIRGWTLAQGYYKRPEETRRSFLANPFSDQHPRGLYRSGDLGRWLEEGSIEILGRADHQVKVRGARVELGEVEAVLSRHPAVRECVVTAVEAKQGDSAASDQTGQAIEAQSSLRTEKRKEKLSAFVSQWLPISD